MIFLSRGVLVDDCVLDRKVLNMATRTPREKFQAGKRMAYLFSIYHEMLKRNEGEAGKGLEKIVYRVMTKSFQTRGMYFLSHPFEWNRLEPRREKRESCITCRRMLGMSQSYCIRCQTGYVNKGNLETPTKKSYMKITV